jgi:hypothetical protein
MQAVTNTGKNIKRDGGIEILDPADREAAANLFQQLGDYGIFVVPRGELESWLKPLGVVGHGPAWLISMFETMGADPSDAAYVKPTEDDVWAFMQSIKTWLTDPNRKGIPE